MPQGLWVLNVPFTNVVGLKNIHGTVHNLCGSSAFIRQPSAANLAIIAQNLWHLADANVGLVPQTLWEREACKAAWYSQYSPNSSKLLECSWDLGQLC